MKSKRRVLGHSLVRSLARLHAFELMGKIYVIELNASISYSLIGGISVPLWTINTFHDDTFQ